MSTTKAGKQLSWWLRSPQLEGPALDSCQRIGGSRLGPSPRSGVAEGTSARVPTPLFPAVSSGGVLRWVSSFSPCTRPDDPQPAGVAATAAAALGPVWWDSVSVCS